MKEFAKQAALGVLSFFTSLFSDERDRASSTRLLICVMLWMYFHFARQAIALESKTGTVALAVLSGLQTMIIAAIGLSQGAKGAKHIGAGLQTTTTTTNSNGDATSSTTIATALSSSTTKGAPLSQKPPKV